MKYVFSLYFLLLNFTLLWVLLHHLLKRLNGLLTSSASFPEIPASSTSSSSLGVPYAASAYSYSGTHRHACTFGTSVHSSSSTGWSRLCAAAAQRDAWEIFISSSETPSYLGTHRPLQSSLCTFGPSSANFACSSSLPESSVSDKRLGKLYL